jgi:rubrerythrin
MAKKQKPDELKTILETARQTEKDGQKFYEEAAAKTANPLAIRMFESLAEAEEKHLELIESLAAGEFRVMPYNGEFPETIKNVFADMPESLRAKAASNPSDVETLTLAIEMEDKSLAFYRNWAVKAASPDARKLCERLAAEEEDHWKILTSTLEYLDNTGNWFMVQEGWTFDGG